MNPSAAVRRLSYSVPVRAAVRSLGLARFAGWLYLGVFVGKRGRSVLEVDGQRAMFMTRTPSELRVLESVTMRERALPELVRLVRPADVVLDVGANRGLYTIFLAQAAGAAGRVIAAEPDPRSLERLQANIALNDLGERVRPLAVALGSAAGRLELCLLDEAMAAVLPADQRAPGTTVEVEAQRGDELLRVQGLGVANVIKVDVEGFEYAVLQGLEATLRQPSCRIVCCEVHPGKLPAGVQPDDIAALLRRHGFASLRILPCPPEFHLLAARREEDWERPA